MQAVVPRVLAEIEAGRGARVARVVRFSGFGGRRAGEVRALLDDGTVVGSLLGGAGDETIDSAGRDGSATLVDVVLGDADAIAAGLGCGGLATVLVTEARAVPREFWAALASGRPAALASRPGASGPDVIAFVETAARSLDSYGSLGDAASDENAGTEAKKALRQGRDSATMAEVAGGMLVVETFLPVTSLLVVGEGGIAVALGAQASYLGWSFVSDPGWSPELAKKVASLGAADAVVVLSHDPEVDTPALAAALATPCFVGALGSRHTQSARRERLRALGLDEETLARIHGPVGLDLGARTPEETALAVAAEILATRSGRTASCLRDSDGPING